MRRTGSFEENGVRAGQVPDPMELRKAFGCFVTGVTIVTTVGDDGKPRGFTANSFTSVSIEPPLVLVCIARTATSHSVFCGAKGFAVNIISEEQRSLSGKFASKSEDKFAGVSWSAAESGSPIFAESAAWLDCALHDRIEAGDHTVLFGRVLAHAHSPRTPLGYYSGTYVTFGLERQMLDAARDQSAQIGGIFEKDARILLVRNGDTMCLPTGRSLGHGRPNSLFETMGRLGLKVAISFIYTVFHDEESGQLNVYYRGDLLNDPEDRNSPAQLYELDQVPWSAMPNHSIELMLRRYVRERSTDSFVIYVGSTTEGLVSKLGPAFAVTRESESGGESRIEYSQVGTKNEDIRG
jgi:flavin reductase (DIM6/NTAB) family NADH-FMN oxidoreductase RutF